MSNTQVKNCYIKALTDLGNRVKIELPCSACINKCELNEVSEICFRVEKAINAYEVLNGVEVLEWDFA